MSALDTSQTTNTTLPQWFTNAQQSTAQGITGALNTMTPPNQTVAQGAIQSLSGPSNPFTTGTATLQDIAHGAANPWLPSGQPDTSTALGGLFSAQNAKLDQILPSIAAKEGAAGIASGNYGGLRGQTAVDTARAGALTTLAEQQNQAALNAQTQGIQAETAAGNLQSQYGTTATNLGNYQQLGALPSYVQASTALGNVGARTDTNQVISKNAGMAQNLKDAVGIGGSILGGATNVANVISGKGTTGLPWLDNALKGIFGGASNPTGGGALPSTQDVTTALQNQGYTIDPKTGYAVKNGINYALDANNNPVEVGPVNTPTPDTTKDYGVTDDYGNPL